jgi:hypothetical protein
MRVAAVFTLLFSMGIVLALVFVQREGGAKQDPPGAGHGPPDIVSEPAGTDLANGIEWQRFTIQGVSVLIPEDGAKNWLSNLNTDICDPLLAQYFVVEYVPTETRFRVDVQRQEVRFKETPPANVRAVADRIAQGFTGAFSGDPRLSEKPRPTPIGICDQPRDEIPPVQRAFEPSPAPDTASTPEPEPSATPAPMPTPVFQN